MKFIKINERLINAEHIVSVSEDERYYYMRMSNADEYRFEKLDKKIVGELNEELQLFSERNAEGIDRNLQRPRARHTAVNSSKVKKR